MSESLLGGNSPSPEPIVPPADAPPVVNNGTPPSWKDSLPDDLKGDPSLISIMDVNALAKSYVHGQKMIGRDKIVIPDKFATDEDWQNVYKKLGAPESADKYDIKAEGIEPEFLKGFKEMAVKNGIMPRQADKLFEFYNGHVKGLTEASEASEKLAYAESVKGLQKEWGQGYERKIQAASGLFNSIADEETKKAFNESGMGNNPLVLKMFAKMAEQMGEDKFVNATNIGSMGLTPAEAQIKINEIYGNKDHPYFHKGHPSNKDAINEMAKYFNAISPKV